MFDIEVLRSRPEPQRAYKWWMDVIGLEGFNPTYVEQVSYSYMEITNDPLEYKATQAFTAGIARPGTLSVVFYEDELGTMQLLLQQWRERIRNLDGTYNYPDEYKVDIMLYLTNSMNEIINTVICEGAFPTQGSPIDLAYAKNDRIVLPQAFAVDKIYLDVPRPEPQGTVEVGFPTITEG